MRKKVLGVGIIGAGPVAQTIHLPTLALLADKFQVTHVMDVSAGVASRIANRVDATYSTSVEEVLADQAVDVVLVGSPLQFHAEQTIAACAAGKSAVLCEKPLAHTSTDANEVLKASLETGVPVVVGAMHTFDPGWMKANEAWNLLGDTARTVTSSIVLPFNDRFEDWSSDILTRPARSANSEPRSADMKAQAMRKTILELAIHNLPLIRRFVPSIGELLLAESLEPYGYHVVYSSGGTLVRLVGYVSDCWAAEWSLDIWGETSQLHLDFPPSFVRAASATATIRTETSTQILGPYPDNGYTGEWLKLYELVSAGASGTDELQQMVDDLAYAVEIAEGAAELIIQGGL
jgi:predicted dehydrogenase